MILTDGQLRWLNQHGGRDEKNILLDEDKKKYIEMYKPPTEINPEDYERIYVPDL